MSVWTVVLSADFVPKGMACHCTLRKVRLSKVASEGNLLAEEASGTGHAALELRDCSGSAAR